MAPAFFRLLAVLLLVAAGLFSPATAAPAEPGAKNRPAVEPADVVVRNRHVVTFRSEFLGTAPAERAERARANILDILAGDSDAKVTVSSLDQGKKISVGRRLIFFIVPADVDPLGQESLDDVATAAARRIEQIIAENREARSLEDLVRSLIAGSIATLVWLALLWGLGRLHHRLLRIFIGLATRKAAALKLAGVVVLDQQHLYPLIGRLIGLLRWLLVIAVSYEWLSFMLSLFPYSRPWGEHLDDYLLGIAVKLGQDMIGAIPGLGVAIAIFFIARSFVTLVDGFLQRLAAGDSPARWVDAEAMPTTRRLVNIAIWLFAVAMAYPYLPGAGTEAFKGLSVLLGLMVSLGASSLVGQAAAGLILTYTRTVRMGEYVRVGEYEGTVTELGMFTTRVRTGTGEELTLPNSLITGTVTQNYSRVVQGRGFIVDTKVTIGYDTPWRQVEALLIEAAKRTPGILPEPKPQVFQTALSDYYPEYLLVAHATAMQAHSRAIVTSALHANILDVFNEYGVQIMSPHYMSDPEGAKVVPPAHWHLPPATPPAPGPTAEATRPPA